MKPAPVKSAASFWAANHADYQSNLVPNSIP
jgi:hypothetical protein